VQGECDSWVLENGAEAASLLASAMLFALTEEDASIREQAALALSRFLAIITTKTDNEQLKEIGMDGSLPQKQLLFSSDLVIAVNGLIKATRRSCPCSSNTSLALASTSASTLCSC